MKRALLRVVDLRTYLSRNGKLVYAVDGVDFELMPGEVLGLVGESGCGKTMTARSIMGLVPGSPGIVGGEIWFSRENLLEGLEKKDRNWRRQYQKRLREIRGKDMGMIFQEPELSLDPLFPVGHQIAEVALAHSDEMDRTHWWQVKRRAGGKREVAEEWLRRMEVDAEYETYPHELSGGMQQRISIGAALAGKPSLLIADEPTSALDVTIQARVLHLLQRIKEDSGLSILLISHDMSVISALADKVVVMYNGRVMERGESGVVLEENPDKHPYTEALLNAVPEASLLVLPGDVPDATFRLPGCRFAPRCGLKYEIGERCDTQEPPEFSVQPGHSIRCWKWEISNN
jgi:oligopeptide/dipeptide ABC transporter ATP-binding protein